jgi:hypothetical protein
MENFAEYILNEKDLASKMEILYYLAKKQKIFFDKSVIFKTEITRLFLNYSKIEVDKNLVLTASLLCNCKKVDNAQEIEKIHTYAKDGAEYLEGLGFNKKFCKMCEEINRYSNSNPRERESDILELVDQFGGMLLDRPERIGFKPDEALVLLEHRNLKDEYNRYLPTFIDFVNYIEKININEMVNMTVLRRLIKIYNETDDLSEFIKEVVYKFEPKVDKLIEKHIEDETEEMFNNIENPNRPLFSEQTAKKIMRHMEEQSIVDIKE